MSGFFAIASAGAASFDPELIGRLAGAIRYRGPDAQHSWIGSQVALGHAQFRTTDEAAAERQPCTIDGEVWISGDIRVDRRSELVRALAGAGRRASDATTDPDLVLMAYLAWGDSFLDRIIGDFSFALWDNRQRRLFCARDQLGVRPLFYAQLGADLLVSNTLSCVQAHPRVGRSLNEDAIADFFLFGFNADPATTTFSAIQRLPAGHWLSWSPGTGVRTRAYWSLPEYPELRLKRPSDYVEGFRDVLSAATADRLRTGKVAVQMSGGLDSTLIAAVAAGLMADGVPSRGLSAYTIVYDRLIADAERHYSGIAARHLEIPVEYLVADDEALFDDSVQPGWCFPEPTEGQIWSGLIHRFNRRLAARSRVALTGFDGDALLASSWRQDLGRSARARDVASFTLKFVEFLRAKQGFGRALKGRLCPSPASSHLPRPFPQWLDPDFAARTDLRGRWREAQHYRQERKLGPRQAAHEAMRFRNWLPTFEGLDASSSGVALDRRHPLADLRVVEFGLSLPAIPWCVDKHIMRKAGKSLLPDAVLERPKAALAGDPVPAAIERYWAGRGGRFDSHPSLGRFVNLLDIGVLIDETKSPGYWFALRAVTLNHWFTVSKD